MSNVPQIPAQAHLSVAAAAAAQRVRFQLEKPHAEELPTPDELRRELPLSATARSTLERSRRTIARISAGEDTRQLVIVGPCSIHDPVAALEYAERLVLLAKACSDVIVVCMRVYFDKPRTSVGWKGFVNDPHLDGSCNVQAGLRSARALLTEIAAMGLPTASELLDPLATCYIEDCLSWAAIGARTSESQPHRELASGLRVPVGLKNPVSGDLESAVHGLVAIRSPHTRLVLAGSGKPTLHLTQGNAHSHLILRGGKAGSNYDPESVARAEAQLQAHGLRARIIVDASHGNSNKDPRRQPDVVRVVSEQLRAGSRSLMGLMLESHLHPGRQSPASTPELQYGVSVTDACLGFEQTTAVLDEFAAALRHRGVAAGKGVVGDEGGESSYRTPPVSHTGAHVPKVRVALSG